MAIDLAKSNLLLSHLADTPNMERSKRFGLTKNVLLVIGLAKPIAICTIMIIIIIIIQDCLNAKKGSIPPQRI